MGRRRRDGGKAGTWAGPLPLSAAIIALALILWFAQVVPTTIYSDCEYAAYWVSGWFSFSSLFQWTAVALAAMMAFWIVSFLDRDRRRAWAETLAQGALLFMLGFWLLAIKSFIFPNATPQLAQMTAIADAVFPHDMVLAEERYPHAGSDDPDQPKVEFEYHPLSYPAINKKTAEIFTSEYSPTGAEMKRLEACVAEQRRAFAQWKQDRETLRAYEENYYYRQTPKRPRDWKEERMEEIERDGE